MFKTSFTTNRKFILLVLIISIISLINSILLTSSGFQKPEKPLLRWIASNEVNLRSGAKTDASIITTLSKGTKIYVVELSDDFAKVSVPSLNNKRGWISRKHITDTKPTGSSVSSKLSKPPVKLSNTIETLKAPLLRYISGSNVNLRSGASSSSKVLKTLPDGTKVYVVQLTGKYAKVSVPSEYSLRGWISREFLTSGKSPNPQPTKNTNSSKGVTHLQGAGSIWSIATVVGDSVNLRASNSLYSKINSSLRKGTKIYLVKDANPWFYVSTPKGKGWVFGNYVERAKVVIVRARNVNIRTGPGKSFDIKQTINGGGTKFAVEESKNGWLKVVSPKYGVRGWINDDFTVNPVVSKPSYPIYYVTGTEINFRKQPRIDAEIIATYNNGVPVRLVGKENRWALVESKGRSGYIYSSYLTPARSNGVSSGSSKTSNRNGLHSSGSSNEKPHNYTKPSYDDTNKSLAQRMINRGMDLRGVPYRWGGTTARGFDCSGFIYYLLNDTGHGVPRGVRTANDFYTNPMSKPVSKEDLQAGDLVFFTSSHRPKSQAGHIGIYLGDGDFLHASSGKSYSVTISNLSQSNYKRRYIGARRVNPRPLTAEERTRYRVQASSSNSSSSRNNHTSSTKVDKEVQPESKPENKDQVKPDESVPPPPKVEVETN